MLERGGRSGGGDPGSFAVLPELGDGDAEEGGGRAEDPARLETADMQGGRVNGAVELSEGEGIPSLGSRDDASIPWQWGELGNLAAIQDRVAQLFAAASTPIDHALKRGANEVRTAPSSSSFSPLSSVSSSAPPS